MTGYSHNWDYNSKLVSGGMIVVGTFLLLEHLFQFGGFDLELIGHEIIGLVLIALGFILKIKWKQLPSFIRAIKNRDWKKILDEGERK